MSSKEIIKKLTDYMPDFDRKIKEIMLKDIEPNILNPRKKFGQEEEDELIESINSKGVLQPIIVYENSGKYVLLDGQRRFQACKKLGLKAIPAHIVTKEPSFVENLSLMFHIHNVHEDWTDLAIASSLQNIIKELGINIEHTTKDDLTNVHKLTSLSYYKINKFLEILKYPKTVIDKFMEAELKEKPDLDLDLLSELRKPIKNMDKFPAISSKYSTEKFVDIIVEKKKAKVITTNKQIRLLSKIFSNASRGKISKKLATEKIDHFLKNPEVSIEQIYGETAESIEQAKMIIKSADKIGKELENLDMGKIPKDEKDNLISELQDLLEIIKRKIKL